MCFSISTRKRLCISRNIFLFFAFGLISKIKKPVCCLNKNTKSLCDVNLNSLRSSDLVPVLLCDLPVKKLLAILYFSFLKIYYSALFSTMFKQIILCISLMSCELIAIEIVQISLILLQILGKMWQKPWKKRENALLEINLKTDLSDFFLTYILK